MIELWWIHATLLSHALIMWHWFPPGCNPSFYIVYFATAQPLCSSGLNNGVKFFSHYFCKMFVRGNLWSPTSIPDRFMHRTPINLTNACLPHLLTYLVFLLSDWSTSFDKNAFSFRAVDFQMLRYRHLWGVREPASLFWRRAHWRQDLTGLCFVEGSLRGYNGGKDKFTGRIHPEAYGLITPQSVVVSLAGCCWVEVAAGVADGCDRSVQIACSPVPPSITDQIPPFTTGWSNVCLHSPVDYHLPLIEHGSLID